MSWAHYLLQVNIYLVVFYGFYKLLLDKETYFVLNRIYLLLAGILSFTIPFLRFDWFAQPVVSPLYNGANQLNELMTQVSVVENSPERWSAGSVVVLVYISGILFFAGKFIYQLLSLRNHLEKAEKGSAFSFFGKKIVDQDLPQFQTINRHEDIHIRQLHTLDILLFELISIFTWFNPIVYLYKHTIKSIHEYLADEEAARFQGDKQQYALLLLGSALGVPPNALTNSFFNKSLIKRRIFMLHKQRSKRAAILKYGLFLPLFAVTLVMSSATIRKNEKILAVADEIPLEQPIAIVEDGMFKKQDDKIYNFNQIDKAPSFPGGMEKFYAYLKKTVKYPQMAAENNIQGKVYISFVVEKNGNLTDVKIDRELGGGTDEEAVRVMKVSPKWNPGLLKKKPVRVRYHIPISFSLTGDTKDQPIKLADQTTLSLKREKDTNVIEVPVDNNPIFFIDGVKVDQQKYKDLKADDIESVTVLKDADATSSYGAEGKNGVVLIKMKPVKKN